MMLNPDQLCLYKWLTFDVTRRNYWAQQAKLALEVAQRKPTVKRGLITPEDEAASILAEVLDRDAVIAARDEREDWPLDRTPVARALLADLRAKKGAASRVHQ